MNKYIHARGFGVLGFQVLNWIDAFALTVTILMAGYNCVFFICKAKIRHTFIILFYLLAFFCLVTWLITAVK